MNFLFFHLKRLLMLPFVLLSRLGEAGKTLWGDSVRSRALLLGLPSVLLACIGIGALCWAKFVVADSLESRYKADAERSAKEKNRLVNEFRREMRMLKAVDPSKSQGSTTSPDDLFPEDDPRRAELENWRSREEVCLEKLIELNPNEPEYLFQLATVSFEKGDRERGLALMNLTAPLDEPGFVKGHLWLADYYLAKRVTSRQEAVQNVSMALNHAEQCLTREIDNLPAKKIKARILFAKQEFVTAYEIYKEIFDVEASYFRPLMQINKRLEKENRSTEILEKAIIRFRQKLKEGNLSESDYVQTWNDLITCYIEKKDFEEGEQALKQEIQRLSKSREDMGKRVWSERLLSQVYLRWTSDIDADAADGSARQLECLKKAYQYDPTNSSVLRGLTRLGRDEDPDIAEEARSVYDAYSQSDAPATVLNEVGARALADEDYETALRYFERALKKDPRNPEILNNLAYTYTVIEPPNPKRALKLIDEALRYSRRTQLPQRYLSFFHDTRGHALMLLDRMTEAAAEFEFALQDRPENREILEAIVKCYSASGLDASAYIERLRKLDGSETPDG